MGVMHGADYDYRIWSTWWQHQLAPCLTIAYISQPESTHHSTLATMDLYRLCLLLFSGPVFFSSECVPPNFLTGIAWWFVYWLDLTTDLFLGQVEGGVVFFLLVGILNGKSLRRVLFIVGVRMAKTQKIK